jgi:hypothetical protein
MRTACVTSLPKKGAHAALFDKDAENGRSWVKDWKDWRREPGHRMGGPMEADTPTLADCIIGSGIQAGGI